MNILTITEYNNMGDLSPGAPQEPPIRVQKVPSGRASLPMTENTRLVALWSGYGGEFAVFTDEGWNEGDPLPEIQPPSREAGAKFVPIQPQYEITRILHMTANLRIAYRDGDHPA